MRHMVVPLLILFSWTAALCGDDQPTQTSKLAKAIADHWLKVSRTNAELFTLSPVTDGAASFLLYEKPIFRHTQSVRGDDIGALHVWTTGDKRPAVVGVVFFWSDSKTTRMGSYEFHSLTPDAVRLKHKDRVVWTSRKPGFDWKTFPQGTPAPARSNLQQRLQANRMARKFTANTTTTDDQRWELRFTPTPIYQYESKKAGVTHGAMYAFCQGTDTEVILLIEAFGATGTKATPELNLSWRYALVPFTDYKARVNYQAQEVWQSPPGQVNEDGKPHFWSLFGSIPKPEFEIKPDK